MAGRDSGLIVARVRYLVRGWNAAEAVAGRRRPLGGGSRNSRDRFAGLPVALVGHSMGGRVAFAVADAPAGRAVVALAPSIEAGGLRPTT